MQVYKKGKDKDEILEELKTVDGAGSGLDADTVQSVGLEKLVRKDADNDINDLLKYLDYKGWQLGTDPTIKVFSNGTNTYFDLFTGNLYVRDGSNVRFTLEKTTGNFIASGVISGLVGVFGPNSSPLRLRGSGTGNDNLNYMQFYESNGSVRQGYIGFPSGGDSHLFIRNDVSGKHLMLRDNGVLEYNGTVETAGTIESGGNIIGLHHISGGDSFFYSYAGSTYGNIRAGILNKGSAREVHFYTDGVSRGHINNSGNMVVNGSMSANNYITTSERRFKRNVQDYECRPMPLKYRKYEYKGEKDVLRVGLVVDEIEKEYPQFIHERDGKKGIAYIDLLIAKTQELEHRLEQLENRTIINLIIKGYRKLCKYIKR